jgi:hypothetical protein
MTTKQVWANGRIGPNWYNLGHRADIIVGLLALVLIAGITAALLFL